MQSAMGEQHLDQVRLCLDWDRTAGNREDHAD